MIKNSVQIEINNCLTCQRKNNIISKKMIKIRMKLNLKKIKKIAHLSLT